MQYGYFDDQAKEYVITRPDTPLSWSNYLGSTQYGAIITNNAGGYGFYKSGAQGRFMRLRFNSIPMDQPGRYFYLRDHESGDYWSVSWQPVGKPLEQFKSTCRHGTAYTIINSEYSGIQAEATYFVPLGQLFEYWRLKVTNLSDRPRQLAAFTYCEFANDWSTSQDLVNLQYTLFITKGELRDGMLHIMCNPHMPLAPDGNIDDDGSHRLWMALIGAPLAGYDTSRAAFLGGYRSYDRPLVVEQGKCTNSDVYGDNACGTLQADLTLAPGETREILIMLGIGDATRDGGPAVARFGSLERLAQEIARLKLNWHSKFGSLTVETPDPQFNSMLNVWAPYNALITFAWSRAASLVYNGERDGLGYRDSVQDVLGVTSTIPAESRQRLELMLTGQVSTGGAMPLIKPFAHRPGHETPPPSEEYRSDDCLWFFNAVPAYVAETGDLDFYNKVLPYADQGEGTVLDHLRRALEFNLERTGRNGLPCGLAADWNDCIKLGYHGESLFVAFQVRLGLNIYAEVAELLGQPAESAWARQQREQLDANIQKCCWDGDWFIWAIGDNGTIYGTKDYEEGQVYLNTQVWSVISGAANPEQAHKCMQMVNERLATPYGLALFDPPLERSPFEVMRAVLFLNGIKENAGIFNHTQSWGVIAECILGNGDRAYEYYHAFMPAAYNDRAEIRQSEPYVQAQTTYSTCSPRAGNTRTSWLSGAVPWEYYSATQYILGIRPEVDGLRLDPCIPANWSGFKATRQFRGKTIEIEVQNPDGICKGVRALTLNDQHLAGNLIPVEELADSNKVLVVLG